MLMFMQLHGLYFQIKWFNGPSPTFSSATELPEAFNQTTLSVRNVQPDDADKYYWCQGTSSMETTQNKCMLDVHCEYTCYRNH